MKFGKYECPICGSNNEIEIGSIWENDNQYRVTVLDVGEHDVWLLYEDNGQKCSWEIKRFVKEYKKNKKE